MMGDDGARLPEYNGGKGGRWEGCPPELHSIFDTNRLLADIKEYVPVWEHVLISCGKLTPVCRTFL